jgi:hypothetical protein
MPGPPLGVHQFGGGHAGVKRDEQPGNAMVGRRRHHRCRSSYRFPRHGRGGIVLYTFHRRLALHLAAAVAVTLSSPSLYSPLGVSPFLSVQFLGLYTVDRWTGRASNQFSVTRRARQHVE